MGLALELLMGAATAPSTTFTGLTMASGNSLTIRAHEEAAPAYLVQAWVDSQVAGTFRVRSPRLHDNVQGIRLDHVAGRVFPLLPFGTKQLLRSQDTLVAEITGSGTAGDLEAAGLLVYYTDLPGSDARLARWEEIAGRIASILTVENTLALGTGGGYTGEEAINAEFNLLRANTDYALLGYYVDAECSAVRYRGSDTGNYGVGGPGEPDLADVTKEWFVLLSRHLDLPCIPVFNSANADGFLIDGVQDENGTDTTVTTILAEVI